MFYDYTLYFIEETDGHINDEGLWEDGTFEVVANIPCDRQPFSHDLAYRSYGYDGNCVYRVFCDYDSHIKLGSIVSFTADHAEEYQIKKIVNWDNHSCEVLVDDI